MGSVEGSKFNLPSSREHNSIPNILNKMKIMVIFEMIFGINRLFLYNHPKSIKLLGYVYCAVIAVLSILFIFISEPFSSSRFLYKDVKHIEYLILSFSAIFLQKKNLMTFIRKLNSFDQKLKIDTDVSMTKFDYLYLIALGVTIIYNLIECIFYLIFVNPYYMLTPSAIFLYIPIITQDIEALHFCVLITIILNRLNILKKYVAKVLSEKTKENGQQIDKYKELSKKVNLDVSTLHEVYDLLHQCFEELNSIMSFPVISILTTAVMSTVALVKNLFLLLENGNIHDLENQRFCRFLFIFVVMNCLKTTIIMMFPCYLSYATKNQAAAIRCMLYDILSNTNLSHNKTVYRKVKAFLLLTHENKFCYAMWGVIKLDLSLPLSYYNLCITYLIISIQFSKIID